LSKWILFYRNFSIYKKESKNDRYHKCSPENLRPIIKLLLTEYLPLIDGYLDIIHQINDECFGFSEDNPVPS